MPAAPAIEVLQPFRAGNGGLVYLKSDVDARDADIARFLVNLRGAWFDCYNQLGRVRDYVEGVE